MKKLLTIITMAFLVLSVLPMIMAASVGTGVKPSITTEDFVPRIWMCDNRVVMDDNTEPGRLCNPEVQGGIGCNFEFAQKNEVCDTGVNSERHCGIVCGLNAGDSANQCYNDCITFRQTLVDRYGGTVAEKCPILKGPELFERINNYAFEGEKVEWKVLVMDKNKIEDITDVIGTVGDVQGTGNNVEVECVRLNGFARPGDDLLPSCNARIQEEKLTTFDDQVMAYYECTLTVETSESMYGEYWITVEAIDSNGNSASMDENEYWFLNPTIALSIDGDMTFDDVRPGTDSYSSTMLVGNDADDGSGVMLDMFISGTDFYDSSSSGARCPITNQLSLNAFRYFVTNGAYNSAQDAGVDAAPSRGDRNTDAEGYTNIGYGIGFNNPDPFYDGFEILQAQPVVPYWTANLLAPGAEMAVTFKLSLPEPCNGDFDSGQIYFWGEAI